MENHKKMRGLAKAKITRIITHVNKAIADKTCTLHDMITRAELLEVAWAEYSQLVAQIWELVDDAQAPIEEKENEETEERYCQIKASLSKLIRELDTTSNSNTAAGSSSPAQPENTQIGSITAQVKLPQINLPSFTGDQLEWSSFQDLFTSLIDSNCKLTNSQKLHYLKNSVKGDAANLLHSIEITDANYGEAWALLKERYEDKRQLIHCHLKSLLSQSNLTQESVASLRNLLDTTSKHVRALTALGLPTTEWDSVIVCLLIERMDSSTRSQWELMNSSRTYPILTEVKEFMEKRCRALEATSTSKSNSVQKQFTPNQKSNQRVSSFQASAKSVCASCKSDHFLFQCPEFTNLENAEKLDFVRKTGACYNCLRTNHSVKQCLSKSSCKICNKRHHTVLHEDVSNQQQTPSTSTYFGNYNSKGNEMQVLLSTALVQIKNSSGELQICRALLDTGSQASFMTEACMQSLGLRRSKAHVAITGIGNSGSGNTRGMANATILSCTSGFTINVDMLIMNKLTGDLPSSFISTDKWTHLTGLKLADEQFNQPSGIDVLLGADVYNDLILDGQVRGQEGTPSAQNTNLGWVVSGRMDSFKSRRITSCISTLELSEQLKTFWEIEECDSKSNLTVEEQTCENHFQQHYTRNQEGRFTVSIPWKKEDSSLGASKDMATRRLHHVERRLSKYPVYKEKYDAFMDQYLSLGHMELIPPQQQTEVLGQTNYLPHHFVLKESSTTTDFRVVFDASAKTTNGTSLNDMMMVGPKLQHDIYDILLRFRFHKYVFTADIAKMYRQILVEKSEVDLHRILWRKSREDKIQEYRLLTVTYGTASAPYLATKVLQQLAIDEGENYPLAKEAILRDFYVDDIMSGDNDLHTALQLQSQLISITKNACLPLRKWSANHPALLESLPQEYRETNLPLCIESDDSIKALGLHWHPAGDYFFFKVNLKKEASQISKRTILSETARLFDPLGWVSPVIVKAKMIMQELWLSGISWDDRIPTALEQTWIQFRSDLFNLENLKIHRLVLDGENVCHQIHGFSDASEKAYSAVIYIRSTHLDGRITSNLLCSKTKVSPLKKITLPRLELCGAVLLSRLLVKIKKALVIKVDSTYSWSDATITLSWIRGQPSKWKTFVANRVSEIQTLTNPDSWGYVPTDENPADPASRGLTTTELINSPLWWHGPFWLSEDKTKWPTRFNLEETTLDVKPIRVLTVTEHRSFNLIDRFSSLSRLTRVTAYWFRFTQNARRPRVDRITTSLTTAELKHALHSWVKKIQSDVFYTTIRSLKEVKQPPAQLLSLNPFIDDHGVLRVGGRIRHSKINFDQKFPIILPQQHHLTDLIIRERHLRLMHGGPQLVLASIQQQFWIVNGRHVVRSHILKCPRCVRDRAVTMEQQMGDLPSHRIVAVRPFLKTGVDFAGPYNIKSMKGRGGKILKAYFSLFVCFATKATHVELVTDLTSETFLAAVKRFVSRRGKPSDVFSDNGSTFVGTNRELKEMKQLVYSKTFNTNIANSLTTDGVNWHFIPARSPHFGGLWEAGVKSLKRHVRHVIGDTILTYEELYTVLVEAEACLNSRPLCPLSSDPTDLTVLTPGHFLIGEPLTTVPDPDLTHLNMNRLSRWQLTKQMSQHFWKRWHLEYLSQLQQRPKWKVRQANIKVGDLVLLKEDNIKPLKWPMGRIVAVHTGNDNCVRVVTLKTSTGEYKRPITKLCLLPFDP